MTKNITAYKANIWKIYGIRLFSNMLFVSAVLVPFFTQWGKVTFEQILFLNAWFMFWNFLLEVPTGTMADFLGRKTSIILGMVVAVLATLVYASYPHIAIFLGAEILFSLAYTLLSGADEALVYDSLIALAETETSKKVFARMESFKLLGIVLGAVLGGVIAKTLNVRMPMILQAIPLFLGGLLALTLTEPEIHEKKHALTFKAYKKILLEGFQFFRQSKVLKILTFDMVFIFAIAWIIIWFYQALLQNVGVDIVHFGLVHAGMCIAQILLIQYYIRLEKWLGSKKIVLTLGALVTGGAYMVLASSRSPLPVIIAILFASGFGLSRLPLFSSYMNKYIPSDKRATILSTTSMLRTMAIVVVNILAGFLSRWSLYASLWILGGIAILYTFFSRIQEEHLID